MTLQDEFLIEIQHAAGQVGPVDGLDGAEMARRAVRRVRARRAALTGVGALAAVVAVVGAWQVAAPTTATAPASTSQAFVEPQPTAVTPPGWKAVGWDDLRLAVPEGWDSTTMADGGTRWAPDPDATEPREAVTVWSVTDDDESGAELPSKGDQHDVPGADLAVVRHGSLSLAGGQHRFLGEVEVTRGDETVAVQYTAPLGGDVGERFDLLVDSLELTGN